MRVQDDAVDEAGSCVKNENTTSAGRGFLRPHCVHLDSFWPAIIIWPSGVSNASVDHHSAVPPKSSDARFPSKGRRGNERLPFRVGGRGGDGVTAASGGHRVGGARRRLAPEDCGRRLASRGNCGQGVAAVPASGPGDEEAGVRPERPGTGSRASQPIR